MTKKFLILKDVEISIYVGEEIVSKQRAVVREDSEGTFIFINGSKIYIDGYQYEKEMNDKINQIKG